MDNDDFKKTELLYGGPVNEKYDDTVQVDSLMTVYGAPPQYIKHKKGLGAKLRQKIHALFSPLFHHKKER